MARVAFITMVAALAVLLAPAIVAAADPAPTPATGTAESVDPVAAPAPVGFSYGPILSRDPRVRGEIKRLYREQWDYNHETNARLQEIAAASVAESDPDLRMVLDREAFQLKKDIEIRNVEFGLEIARLNEDETRVADFERALDQLLNPDKYRPDTLDPSIGDQRARDMGLK